MLKQGDLVAGRYVLNSLIGEGAMGAVWCAEDQTLKRQVAIKFLFVRGARDPQAMVEQFLREARIAASVQHRNVIHTVDFGTVDDQPFMVMELLSGESLGDRMARDPPLSPEQFVHIAGLTLRGLSAVHDAGIVHRDLKPQNIFLQRDAEAVYPKILDFGISRSLGDGERASAIATQAGMIVGTPDYMSPEQARGEVTVDRRADIYAMGAILFEGMTGRLPFVADTIGDLIVQIVTTEAPDPRSIEPRVPKPIADLIKQAMSRNREHRFTDARAMRRALMAAAEAAWPRGMRMSASMAPPGMSSTADGVSTAHAPPPARSPGHGATWGDFEGLEAARIRDAAPAAPGQQRVHSLAPAKQQRLVARAEDPSVLAHPAAAPSLPPLDLPPAVSAPPMPPPSPRPRASHGTRRAPPERAESAAVAPPRAKSAGKARPRPPSAPVPSGMQELDAFDPLYQGADLAAPELDYDRNRPSLARKRSQAGAGKPAQRKATQATRGSRGASVVLIRPSIGGWILPIVALALVAYLMYEPELPSTSTDALASKTADAALRSEHARDTPRREKPGSAPPHLRDVVSE